MNKFKSGLKWFLNSYIWLGVVLLIVDIITKNAVVLNADKTKVGIDLIPGFLRIQYLVNPNIAFGMSTGNLLADRILFSIIALTVSAGIIVYLIKKWGKINRFYKAVAFMILSGAIGNVIDRLFYSAEYLNYGGVAGVVDWIDFYGIWGFHFNIADSAVVVAAFMMIIYMIVEEVIDYKKKKALEPKEESKENKEEKVLSKTEQEKQRLLEESKQKDE